MAPRYEVLERMLGDMGPQGRRKRSPGPLSRAKMSSTDMYILDSSKMVLPYPVRKCRFFEDVGVKDFLADTDRDCVPILEIRTLRGLEQALSLAPQMSRLPTQVVRVFSSCAL